MLGHGTGRHKGRHLARLATESTDDEYSIFNIEYSRLLPSPFVSSPFRVRWGGWGNKIPGKGGGGPWIPCFPWPYPNRGAGSWERF